MIRVGDTFHVRTAYSERGPRSIYRVVEIENEKVLMSFSKRPNAEKILQTFDLDYIKYLVRDGVLVRQTPVKKFTFTQVRKVHK